MTQTDGMNGRFPREQGIRAKQSPEAQQAPLSPISDGDHSVQTEMRVRCFFSVLDPEGTARLKGTKNSACLGSFKSVNRLKEHLWRAHSPTHNCVSCRQKTTKPTREFRELHALCRPGSKIARPLPTLISDRQAEALRSLNQHFNKPNNETARCEKLWKALFPDEDFDEKRFVCSLGAEGADGEQPGPNHNHTSSPLRKTSQPTTPTRGLRQQVASPPASPHATQGSRKAQNEPLFPVVKKPTQPVGIAPGPPSLDSGIGMGDEINKQDTPSRRGSVDDGAVGSRIQGVGSVFPGAPEKPYARRVQVGGPGEDSTPAHMGRKDFEVRHNSIPDTLRRPFVPATTQSAYPESITSQSDTDMCQSDDNEGGEDDDSDMASIGGDSAMGDLASEPDMDIPNEPKMDHMDAVRAINSRDIDIMARRCGDWDSDEDESMGSESDY